MTKPAPRRKTSHALTTAQVRLIKNGVRHAIRIGLPLNRALTIDWEAAGVDDVLKAQTAFLKLLRDWLKKRGATAYVWVFECGGIIGLHSHILIHIPPASIKPLTRRQRGWLKQVGVLFKNGVIRSTPIGHTSEVALSSDADTHAAYRKNLKQIVGYILKAADAKARQQHGLTNPPQYSIVSGKRAGTSRNIGAKAISLYKASV